MGPDIVKSIRGASKLFFDCHLMISDPEKYMESFIKAGAELICFHAEAVEDIDALIDKIHSYGVKADDVIEGVRLNAGVTVNVETREVAKNGVRLDMRDKEVDVLLYLVKNRGRVVSSDELYRAVWGEIPLSSSGNNVTVHILNLRRKLEDSASGQKVIRTVWGKGYQID
jgi:two-component system response regulator VanR